jgi:hypothetical protein
MATMRTAPDSVRRAAADPAPGISAPGISAPGISALQGDRSGRSPRVARVARAGAGLGLVVAGAFVLAGCELLGIGGGSILEPIGSFGPSQPYTAGTATMAIDGGQTIVLEGIRTGSSYGDRLASATWGSVDGWELSVSTFGPSGSDALLSIARTGDNVDFAWLENCDTSFTASAEGLVGSASCDGVSWSYGGGAAADAFTVEVIFEARP